jgi:hypothetical protein
MFLSLTEANGPDCFDAQIAAIEKVASESRTPTAHLLRPVYESLRYALNSTDAFAHFMTSEKWSAWIGCLESLGQKVASTETERRQNQMRAEMLRDRYAYARHSLIEETRAA